MDLFSHGGRIIDFGRRTSFLSLFTCPEKNSKQTPKYSTNQDNNWALIIRVRPSGKKETSLESCWAVFNLLRSHATLSFATFTHTDCHYVIEVFSYAFKESFTSSCRINALIVSRKSTSACRTRTSANKTIRNCWELRESHLKLKTIGRIFFGNRKCHPPLNNNDYTIITCFVSDVIK